MNRHPQAKYAAPIIFIVALGISFVSQGRGTIVNALGASLGVVLASFLLASIAVGLLWIISLLISRKSFPLYAWVNTAAILALIITLLFVAFAPSLQNRIAKKTATATSSQDVIDKVRTNQPSQHILEEHSGAAKVLTPAPAHPIGLESIDEPFRCPEDLPSEQARVDAIGNFIRLTMERQPDLTLGEIIQIRLRLLEEHNCEIDSANYSAGG